MTTHSSEDNKSVILLQQTKIGHLVATLDVGARNLSHAFDNFGNDDKDDNENDNNYDDDYQGGR